MIKINHLTITQNKDLRDLVSDLNITIQDGEKVAIIGEEGNGKSSLLHVLMSPKSLPDYLTIEGEITNFLSLLCLYSPVFAGSIEGKNIGRIFLEKTS